MEATYGVFDPALLNPDTLLAGYAARRLLLDQLVGFVRDHKPGDHGRHSLLIGPRGMGKTTTLLAVAYRINLDRELSCRWLPVIFEEESPRIADLADFWMEAIRKLEIATRSGTNLTAPLLLANSPEVEKEAFELFSDLVAKSGRRVILFIDNIDDVLVAIRDTAQMRRLRSALEGDSGIVLVGAATSYFEQITSVEQPFYGFFQTFELKALTLDETNECLVTLARNSRDASVEHVLAERGGSIQAMHLLTGGIPRLIKPLYNVLRQGLHADIRSSLKKLLDEFTPYYKSIFDALPRQQRVILDAVARNWNPSEVSMLATTTRLPANQVSAQLRALLKLGIIREAAANPTKKSYLLADRFSQIFYLMRHEKHNPSRLDWFVATLNLLFPDKSPEHIAKLVKDNVDQGKEGLQEAKTLIRTAICCSDDTAERRRIVNHVMAEAWSSDSLAQLWEWLDLEKVSNEMPEVEALSTCLFMPIALREKIGYHPEKVGWWSSLESLLDEAGATGPAEAARDMYIMRGYDLRRHPDEETKTLSELRRDLENSTIPWTELIRQSRRRRRLVKSGNVVDIHRYDREIGFKWAEEQQDLRKSKDEFRKVLESKLTTVEEWCLYGKNRERFCQIEHAMVAYRRALELDPNQPDIWRDLGTMLALYVDFLSSHNPQESATYKEEALHALRKATEVGPSEVSSWTALGFFLSQDHKQNEAAVAAYYKAAELSPNDASIWHCIGDLLKYKLEQEVEAENAYRKATELNPENAEYWNDLGEFLTHKKGRVSDAEAAFRRAIGLSSKNAVAWERLGDVLQLQPDRAIEAEAALKTAIEVAETGTQAKLWMKLAYLQTDLLKQPSAAEKSFREAIVLRPNWEWPWNSLGALLHDQLNRAEDAVLAFRKATELDPRCYYAWSNLGTALITLARYDEAVLALRSSLDIMPNDAALWNKLGSLLHDNLGNSAEAETAFRSAIDYSTATLAQLDAMIHNHSDDSGTVESGLLCAVAGMKEISSQAWSNLGTTLTTQGKYQEAEIAQLEAIRLYPGGAWAVNKLADLLQFHLERPAEAEATYRKAIASDPGLFWPRLTLGNVLLNDTRYLDAEAVFRDYSVHHPDDNRAWTGLGLALRHLGRLNEARHCIVNALSLDPSNEIARQNFAELCTEYPEAWERVLPMLVAWTADHPNDVGVFAFATDGLVQHARLTTPAKTLEILKSSSKTLLSESLPFNSPPFEAVHDALRSCEDIKHLNRLAPERQAVAVELMKRIKGDRQTAAN